MSVCADKDWSMELLKDDSTDPERFNFRDVKVVNGILTGKVYDSNEKVTYLRGTCSTLGYMAHMTFFFTAAKKGGGYVDIVLLGWGLEVPGQQPVFKGRFEVFTPAIQGTSVGVVNFDPGDTGTGTGMQAQ